MQAFGPNDITTLLHAASAGDEQAFDVLFERVYKQLHRLAHQVRRNRAGQTLNTTALVHESYLKMFASRHLDWNDRVHFFRVCARAMRQVLVNAAERRMAAKRGGGELDITFDEQIHAGTMRAEDLLTLDEALRRLEIVNRKQADVVECRFFAGLTIKETAAALDVSTQTVKRNWRIARAWLTRELTS